MAPKSGGTPNALSWWIINTLWYIYSMEYYSAGKRASYYPGNRTNNKCFILSKSSQSAKMIYRVVPLHEVFLEKVKRDDFFKIQ